ncbi:MAG: (d)CMP kinase [Clostridia bacterium]|nr:(d)CMP kinase [Clostridia bacterium]MEE0807821.1 (d)CMP kinase [Acutalibacteraceae bacterium]
MISIALDGPAGAGKSTLAKGAAKALGFIYVDTGALYRAVGLKFSKAGYDTTLDCDVESILAETDVDIKFIDGVQHVMLDGEDVSDLIRTPEASMMASAVSAKPPVRAFLLEMQRKLARENNVLMDGRDIGTVVLPNATVKIFVTASVEERANRRYKELCEKGMDVKYEDIYKDIETRDYNDSHRAIAPLKPADDAIMYDTTGNTLEQSLEGLLKILDERLK